MSIRFNADEIFEMAEQIEINGGKFYRRAAEMVSDPAARRKLLALAEAEDEHRKTFAEMRSELSGQEKSGTFDALNEELSGYLRAWADGQVFDVGEDPSLRLTGRETLEDIYRMAIGLEKDSVVFYLGLKDATPAKWGRGRIDDIIREEMKHIAVLGTEIATLRGEVH
jgi:rubrerythrin